MRMKWDFLTRYRVKAIYDLEGLTVKDTTSSYAPFTGTLSFFFQDKPCTALHKNTTLYLLSILTLTLTILCITLSTFFVLGLFVVIPIVLPVDTLGIALYVVL
jgi:hypothetical protein